MKTLNYYTDSQVTKAFEDNGAFFAFSNAQFDEKKKPGVKYQRLHSGCLCPVENVDLLINQLDSIYKEGKKQLLKENSIENLIKHELENHECYYTGSYADALDVLKEYDVTEEQVRKIYNEELKKGRE